MIKNNEELKSYVVSYDVCTTNVDDITVRAVSEDDARNQVFEMFANGEFDFKTTTPEVMDIDKVEEEKSDE